MIERLLSNLYSAINTDPQASPAILIGFTPINAIVPAAYWVEVKDGVLYGTNGVGLNALQVVNPLDTPFPHANLAIPLRGVTLQAVVDVINATAGFTAELIEGTNPQYSALMLVDGVQDVVENPRLPIALSLLWAMYRPVADALVAARDDTGEALKQISPQFATGVWLSSLGDLYGVDRQADEDDVTYRQRVLYTVLKPRANNVAMADYLKFALALQSVDVTDDDASLHTGIAPDVALPYKFFVDLQPNATGGLPISPASIYNIVQAIKAWGTIWSLRIIDLYSETYPTAEIEADSTIQITGAPEDASGLRGFDVGTLTLVAHNFEFTGLPKGVLRASVWKTNGTTNLPTNIGYDPSIGSIVSSRISDASILTPASDGGGYGSIIESITEQWQDVTGHQFNTNESYDTAAVGEAAIWRMETTEVFTTTDSVVDTPEGLLSSETAEPVPMRWRPFRASDYASQASTLTSLISDPPAPRTTLPYEQTLGELSRFAVIRGATTTWYSDTHHPASP
jgi:hypothetical protein